MTDTRMKIMCVRACEGRQTDISYPVHNHAGLHSPCTGQHSGTEVEQRVSSHWSTRCEK